MLAVRIDAMSASGSVLLAFAAALMPAATPPMTTIRFCISGLLFLF
jgi:hypothetical protein